MIMKSISFVMLMAFLVGCNTNYTSRPTGYFNIDLPAEHKYQDFNLSGYPYGFQYPTYSNIVQDSTYFENSPENDYWINLDFPQFDAKVFLSYKRIGGNSVYKVKTADGTYKDSLGINKFEMMVNDAFTLTSKNEVVAKFIKDSAFVTAKNIGGVLFKVGGDAATAQQFFLTDSTKNFIRGALYFNTTPNADSLKPVLEFLQKDITHFINTFYWKN